MLAQRSIAYKLILVITVCSVIIFAVTIGYFYYQSRIILETELENNARNLVLSSVNRVETELTSIGKVAEGVVHSLETGTYTDSSLNSLLKRTLGDNKQIFGVGAAFEPDASGIRSRPYVPYFYRKSGQLIFVEENTFQFLILDWYNKPKVSGKKCGQNRILTLVVAGC